MTKLKDEWFCLVCGATFSHYGSTLRYVKMAGKVTRRMQGGAGRHYAETGHGVRMRAGPRI
jgi:hypothetical protein